MLYFKAKMHQIWFRLGLRHRLHCRSSQRSSRLSSWILGILLFQREVTGTQPQWSTPGSQLSGQSGLWR